MISSSPERLVQVRDRVISTRPIAGTYPRSDDASQDRRLAQALYLAVRDGSVQRRG